jgi:hypothetical protein
MEELKRLGTWTIKKELIKQRYQNVTDADLDFDEDHEDEMLERLNQKTGITKKKLIEEINKI